MKIISDTFSHENIEDLRVNADVTAYINNKINRIPEQKFREFICTFPFLFGLSLAKDILHISF